MVITTNLINNAEYMVMWYYGKSNANRVFCKTAGGFHKLISLKHGVLIRKAFAAELKKAGIGVLYVLNTDIAFEKMGKGLVWNVSYQNLASFEAANKNQLIITWHATDIHSNTRRWIAKLKVRDTAQEIEEQMRQANTEYAELASFGGQKAG